ncbi:MAG: hypothetical protein GY842_16600 [bacterium]|nr:hypothetical protein [bacterium]
MRATRSTNRRALHAVSRPASASWKAVCLCGVAAMLGLGASARAEENTVQNDIYVAPGSIGLEADFGTGEQGGVVLTSPCGGSIVALQIGWASSAGGTMDSIERSVFIYADADTFPIPGAVLAELVAPVLADGAINEFRYLDEQSSIPIDVPVTAGQKFYVTLEFENATSIAGGTACLFHDVNVCEDDKNVLYGNPGLGTGWYDLCNIGGLGVGISGDLVIRAVVDCQEPTGACCEFDASCANGVQEGNCQGAGQTFFVGETCAGVTCPPPTGACCIGEPPNCAPGIEQSTCEAALGTYAGDGTDCGDDVCALGACCYALGDCAELIGVDCVASGGDFQGPGTVCVPNDCDQPTGACCTATDVCFPNQEQAGCEGFGTWAGPFTSCFVDICPLCDDGNPDQDLDVDLVDFARMQECMDCVECGAGPCKCLDMDNDNDVDLDDFVLFQVELDSGGPG